MLKNRAIEVGICCSRQNESARCSSIALDAEYDQRATDAGPSTRSDSSCIFPDVLPYTSDVDAMKTFAVTMDGVEHDLGAADVRPERTERLLDDEPHADRGAEVDDDVACSTSSSTRRSSRMLPRTSLKLRLALERAEVGSVARRHVVERDDGVAALEQGLGEVGADESGPAGDEIAHEARIGSGR